MGVDHPIDYKKKSVLELDQKVDIFFDVVSNLSFTKCRHLLNPGGIYITLLTEFSFLTGLLSSFFTSKKCRMFIVKSKNETLKQLSKLIDEDKIKVPVSSHFEINRISEALDLLNQGIIQGKVAIRF